jgi:hypothetical protein
MLTGADESVNKNGDPRRESNAGGLNKGVWPKRATTNVHPALSISQQKKLVKVFTSNYFYAIKGNNHPRGEEW